MLQCILVGKPSRCRGLGGNPHKFLVEYRLVSVLPMVEGWRMTPKEWPEQDTNELRRPLRVGVGFVLQKKTKTKNHWNFGVWE